ncbi:hypothetical protein GCM10011613_24990 [Cellvibrio zantedeschiae]|uniref:Uncharacterized protein n=1 Tax=Cellvibrio zantedeschiae TaxID=1237077 RepID=A0ABQ3B5D3_9GAMM|nr:hypothetical protein [Cellvibrio zantedeschiae]GGY79185.1 hypothetical protein GCM10011613_24990 [Cellvibrio zantedeschiae]
MVTLAFVEHETGWIPCRVAEVKRGDTFYLVSEGKQGPLMVATSDAKRVNARDEESWTVDSKPME